VIEALVHDVLKQLPGALPVERIGVQNAHVGFRMGRACKIGPRSFSMPVTASNWARETAKGALFTVAMR
jgi:hypothetical protein